MRWSAWPPPNEPRSTSSGWLREKKKGLGNEVALDGRLLIQDDLCLLRMKRQPAFGEPSLKQCPQIPRLFLTATMADDIIGIALEGDNRAVPAHPLVERIMQKEIRQEGADDPALRRPSFPCDDASILHLLGRLQPPLDVQKHPPAIRMLANCA